MASHRQLGRVMEQGQTTTLNFVAMCHEMADHRAGSQFTCPAETVRTVISGGVDQGTTFLLRFSAGYHRLAERRRSAAGRRRFERHSCHEEIFCLAGEICFADFYALTGLGYLNHPPQWVHPADQYSGDGGLPGVSVLPLSDSTADSLTLYEYPDGLTTQLLIRWSR